MDFTDSISVMPSEQFSMKIYDKSHTTLKNNCFQKLCRRSTVTSDPTCDYWRDCRHNLNWNASSIFGPSCTTVSSYYVYRHQNVS